MSLIEQVVSAAPFAAGWTTYGLFSRRRLAAARHCPLTQLLTRDGWEKAALRRLLRGNTAVAVIDLDGFKAVNDTYGHAAGDAVLKATGHRLHLWAGASNGVAGRLGGDEFALVMSDTDFRAGIEQLHDLLTAPVDWHGQQLEVGASIGGVIAEGLTLSEALSQADQAMYQIKGSGGRRGPRRHQTAAEAHREVTR
ncbi:MULTISPECIES: GGDEF domain-containing protein [unclassified Streptomyces]|uniref:GGDEF domain-containing protein n=1 Tax=unclassified Streptomyces TaxID=2593676 RepID=UPI00278C0CAB|nr:MULTISPECIES: GGDEF domain-containing protein [unclassified Streptomyces]